VEILSRHGGQRLFSSNYRNEGVHGCNGLVNLQLSWSSTPNATDARVQGLQLSWSSTPSTTDGLVAITSTGFTVRGLFSTTGFRGYSRGYSTTPRSLSGRVSRALKWRTVFDTLIVRLCFS
jgi:hypothetical protein